MKNKKIAIVGCGKLGKIVGEAYNLGLLDGYTLVATMSRKKSDSDEFSAMYGGKSCKDIEGVIDEKPDYIIETASVKFVKENTIRLLEEGISVIPLSIGAFADEEFKKASIEAANKGNAKVYIPSGAIGGYDVLSTVTLMAEAKKDKMEASIRTEKNERPLRGTKLYKDGLDKVSKKTDVFTGNAKEVIEMLPTQVNVAVAAALSSAGALDTKVKIRTVPGFIGDDHKIKISTDGIEAVIDVYSSTSDIAGWSVVSLLRNINSPIEFF